MNELVTRSTISEVYISVFSVRLCRVNRTVFYLLLPDTVASSRTILVVMPSYINDYGLLGFIVFGLYLT